MKTLLKCLRVSTPLGGFHLVGQGTHLVGAYFDNQRFFPRNAATWADGTEDALLLCAAEEVNAFFRGTLAAFDVPLAPSGTAFQQKVWSALLGIPQGRVATYGEIAHSLGAPQASRAVGAAIGRNPLSLFVPCHRVIGKNGSLTGYAGGLERKQRLLALEGKQRPLALEGNI
jgi:methylated-DNA-[protein]-cysteine S-methyltransferase